MKKEDVEIWCGDNNFVLVDMNTINKNALLIKDAVNIAEISCRRNSGEVFIKTNDSKIVFTRWLLYDYLKKTTNITLINIGFMFARRDHSTVIHGIKTLNTEYFIGWRKEYKERFENKINEAHVKLGFKKVYV